jgi:HTH-type transcriptional regulator, sugar sensing transcriptional regulator
MEDKVNQVLGKVGLNKNEIKIYLDLLKFKNSSALDISKRTGIHRSNTYDAIRKLINIGFIKEVVEERKRSFSSIDPEKIKHYIKQQESEVDAVLPYLKGISSEKKDIESVSMIKGVFAVREALSDLLKLNKTINVYGASNASVNALGEGFLNEFHTERIKKKILMRHIYDESSVDRVRHLNKLNLTEAKYFPKKYFTIAATNICDDITLIIVFSNPLSAILIKNKEIAEAYNKYFELLWKQAKIP